MFALVFGLVSRKVVRPVNGNVGTNAILVSDVGFAIVLSDLERSVWGLIDDVLRSTDDSGLEQIVGVDW